MGTSVRCEDKTAAVLNLLRVTWPARPGRGWAWSGVVGEARRVELAESAAVGRVYVVMGEPSKILNAHEATTLGMDILLWRAQEDTRKEILPDGIAAPEARSAISQSTVSRRDARASHMHKMDWDRREIIVKIAGDG